jgi:DNA-directed RNA polymerase specialized sigma24 family protein
MSRPEVKTRLGSARTPDMLPYRYSGLEDSGDESLLIRQAQAGKPEAFARLATHYDRPILTLALRLTDSETEALRLSQQAWLTAYRELHTYNFRNSFFVWIYTVAVRACLEFLERNPAPSAATEFELQQLSPRERLVLELKHCFGLKLETIAAMLEIPELAARNALVRATIVLQTAHK